MIKDRKCSIKGCESKHEGHDLCKKHRRRFLKHGSPFGFADRSRRVNEDSEFVLRSLESSIDECILWPFNRNDQGYACIKIDNRTTKVHVVVATIVYGPKPTNRHGVAHSCNMGDKGCMNHRHLRWATQKENMMDAAASGRICRGSRVNTAKIEEDDVFNILILVSSGKTHKEVAEVYGISREQVRDINSGRRWGWLTGNGKVVALVAGCKGT